MGDWENGKLNDKYNKYIHLHHKQSPDAPKTRTNPERAIQRALLAELAVLLPLGAMVFHIPNEDAGKSMLYGLSKIRDGILPGCPDLLILHQGRAYWLELKAGDNGLNDNQLKAHPRLRAAGSPVEVIYSVEDGVEACRAWGLVRERLQTPPNHARARRRGGSGGVGATPGAAGAEKPLAGFTEDGGMGHD